ncbi:MAG: class I SAM-dependent methyltransferase [Rhodobacteraceae bacterium]|nr:class I SAM-dependent methyltransferase [Paracoccaceae bacterium]
MDKDRIKAFADKVYGDMAGAMAMGMAFVGVKKGLFSAMAEQGPMTREQVVAATNLQPRYVEEWLAGMTTAGYLDYDPDTGTFALPDEHSYLVASEGTDHFMGGLFCAAPGLLSVAPKVAEAFEQGGGIRFEDYGPDFAQALDLINSGQYEQRLTSYWLPQLPDVAERLEAGGRVLDVGCGVGRVAMTLATAFPSATVVGLDPDRESIRLAEKEAAAAGLSQRIDFIAETTRQYTPDQPFDLITAFDCVHDFAEPEATLQDIRSLLAADGTLFIVEPRAADRLEENVNALGAVYYGFSLFHCMTQSLANGGPGLGTCMGPAKTKELLGEAGFSSCEQLGIRSLTHLFYSARP